MSGRGVSIALVMKVIALVALNLAILRLAPFIPESPPFFCVLVTLDIMLVQTLVLRRRLGVFHYTFFIVGFVSSIVTSIVFFMGQPRPDVEGSMHVLETLVGWYRALSGDERRSDQFDAILRMAERCVTGIVSLLPAWAAGVLAV